MATRLAIAATDASKAEGDTGSTLFTFTITRSGNIGVASSVTYTVTGSGANAATAADFTGAALPTGTVSFAAGEASKLVTINVAGDTTAEANEGFTVTLSAPSAGTTIATAAATGTIVNDDVSSLAIAATDASKAEGDTGSTPFTFTVTRTGNTSGASSVTYTVTGSGANAATAADFTGAALPTGTVSFAAGETSKLVTINVAGDTTAEANEGFTVTLSAPSAGTTITTAAATGTIVNDDASSSLAIAATDASKAEGNTGSTPFTFTVTRSGDTSGASSVTYTVTGSGANAATAADFTGAALPTGTVSFAAGETSKLVTINVAGDTTAEANEGFTVTLSAPSAGTTITTAAATGTIVNDDASSSLAIAATDASKAEGNTGSTPFTFTVTRSGDTTGASSATYTVTGSGANAATAADFTGAALPTGTVSFAAGETSKLVTINVAGDTTAEANEGFTVTLSAPSAGTTITTAAATGTIVNDDASSSLAIAATDASKAEGNTGSTPFTFTVTRSGDTTGASSATYTVTGSGANAAAAADFTGAALPTGTVSFAAGETSKLVTINVAGDTTAEANEGFTVTLSAPSAGTTITTAAATGTIVNDDASSSLAIAATDASKAEGNTGSTPFTFTVTRSGDTTGASSATYTVTGSGANAATAADFTGAALPTGTVSFAAGETSKLVTINVAGDTTAEANEGFTVTLSAPSAGTTITTAAATGTIVNDDASSSLAIAATDASKAEGNTGSTPFTFTVTRSGDTTGASSATYTVTGSGANAADAADFTGAALPTGTVSFAAGETSKLVTINVAGDTTAEANEGFTVTLSAPSAGTTITTAAATGTIVNDDAPLETLVTAINVGGQQFTAANGITYLADPGPTTGTTNTFATVADIVGTTDDPLYNTERWTSGGSYTYEIPVANGTYRVELNFAEIYSGITGAGQRVFDMSLENQPLSSLQNIDIYGQVGANAPFVIDQLVTVTDGSLSIQVGPGSNSPGNVQNAKLNAFSVFSVGGASASPSLAIAATDASKAEGNTGSTPFTFTVTRSGDTSGASSATYTVTGSGANAADAADFTGAALPTGTVSFAAGETSKLVTINVAGDTTAEANEGFTVTLSAPSAGTTITTAAATGTIVNDDTSASSFSSQEVIGGISQPNLVAVRSRWSPLCQSARRHYPSLYNHAADPRDVGRDAERDHRSHPRHPEPQR